MLSKDFQDHFSVHPYRKAVPFSLFKPSDILTYVPLNTTAEKMIMPSDKEYIATKQIMLGKANMNPDFVELANFINQTFNVKPINILYDTIDKEKRPRLNNLSAITFCFLSYDD